MHALFAPGLASDLSGVIPFLAGWAVKATVLLGMAGVVVALRRRASATFRHAVWTAALTSILALPMLSSALPDWPVAAPMPVIEELRPSEAVPPAEPAPTLESTAVMPDAGDAGSSKPAGALETAADWMTAAGIDGSVVVLSLWAAGFFLVIAWMVVGHWGVWRLAKGAEPVGTADWLRTTHEVATRNGIRRPVSLLASDKVTVPITCGLVWPVVFLPRAADGWPPAQRRAVLEHEIAHVKRHDCLTQLIAHVACAVFWPHPGVWYAARRLRIERERACDDHVLGTGIQASDYARHVLEVARSLSGPKHIAAARVGMAETSQLESRVVEILKANRNRRHFSRSGVAWFATAGLIAALPLAVLQPAARAGTLVGTGTHTSDQSGVMSASNDRGRKSSRSGEMPAGRSGGEPGDRDVDTRVRVPSDRESGGTGMVEDDVRASSVAVAESGVEVSRAAGNDPYEPVYMVEPRRTAIALAERVANDSSRARDLAAAVAHLRLEAVFTSGDRGALEMARPAADSQDVSRIPYDYDAADPERFAGRVLANILKVHRGDDVLVVVPEAALSPFIRRATGDDVEASASDDLFFITVTEGAAVSERARY